MSSFGNAARAVELNQQVIQFGETGDCRTPDELFASKVAGHIIGNRIAETEALSEVVAVTVRGLPDVA